MCLDTHYSRRVTGSLVSSLADLAKHRGQAAQVLDEHGIEHALPNIFWYLREWARARRPQYSTTGKRLH